MTPPPTIRPEAPGDAPAIYAVHQAAFPTDAEARLVHALRAAGRLTVSLVAVVDGAVAGHVALSPVTIEGSPAGLGLAPLAVVPQRQRAGVGTGLVRRALAECRALGAPLVVVLGEPAFYARLGFGPAAALGLRDEYGGGDAFQAVALTAQPPPRGLVQYAPEFAALA